MDNMLEVVENGERGLVVNFERVTSYIRFIDIFMTYF